MKINMKAKKSKELLKAEAYIAELHVEINKLRVLTAQQSSEKLHQLRDIEALKRNEMILLVNQERLMNNLIQTDQMLVVQTLALEIYRKQILNETKKAINSVAEKETNQYALAK